MYLITVKSDDCKVSGMFFSAVKMQIISSIFATALRVNLLYKYFKKPYRLILGVKIIINFNTFDSLGI